jgi:hypothetical protein
MPGGNLVEDFYLIEMIIGNGLSSEESASPKRAS